MHAIDTPSLALLIPILVASKFLILCMISTYLVSVLQNEIILSFVAKTYIHTYIHTYMSVQGRALRDRGADLKRKSAAITGTRFFLPIIFYSDLCCMYVCM